LSRSLTEQEKNILVDRATQGWEVVLRSMGEGGDVTFAFLQLAQQDLLTSASTVDCRYCRKHVLEEAKLIGMTIDLAKMGNQYTHAHGVREKWTISVSSFKIIVYIALGGLRRIGLIS
jgi:hypothetical protein